MKLTIIIFALLFVAFCKITNAQENHDDLQLFDSFSGYNCEDLLSRLDGFAIYTAQNPNSIGYVVIYDNNNPVDN